MANFMRQATKLERGKRYAQSALATCSIPLNHTPFSAHSCSPKTTLLLGENLKETLAPTILASGLGSLCFDGWVSCLPRLPGCQLLSAFIPNPWLLIWPLTPWLPCSCRTQMSIHFLIYPGFLAVRYQMCFWAQWSTAMLLPAGSSGSQAIGHSRPVLAAHLSWLPGG